MTVKRTTEKQKITAEEYNDLLTSCLPSGLKDSSKFVYEQQGQKFSLKYDDFGVDKPKVLEVDVSRPR